MRPVHMTRGLLLADNIPASHPLLSRCRDGTFCGSIQGASLLTCPHNPLTPLTNRNLIARAI